MALSHPVVEEMQAWLAAVKSRFVELKTYVETGRAEALASVQNLGTEI
jgi:hypothetical protein